MNTIHYNTITNIIIVALTPKSFEAEAKNTAMVVGKLYEQLFVESCSLLAVCGGYRKKKLKW